MNVLALYRALFGALLTLVSSCLFAQDAPTRKEPDALPSLRALVSLFDKSTTTPAFFDVRRRCGLSVVEIKQTLFVPSSSPPNRHEAIFVKTYGGAGLVIIAAGITHVEGDLEGAAESIDFRVKDIQLIIGPCKEQETFGTWQGERLPFDLPSSPEALRKMHPHDDTDVVEVIYGNGGAFPISRRRKIDYYVPAVGNPFPYAFIFNNDRLAIIELKPPDKPAKIIRPEPPSPQSTR